MADLEDYVENITLADGRQVSINIKSHVELTMFDGKVVNALTNTKSSASWNICGAKPSEMNNSDLVKVKPVNDDALSLGLSSLHCWIKCFEDILHLRATDSTHWR